MRLSAFGDLDDIEAEPLSADARAEIERDALAAWNQAMDEREFDQAEVARLEVLAAQREAMTSADEIPFLGQEERQGI